MDESKSAKTARMPGIEDAPVYDDKTIKTELVNGS
jgi:hypothetical protein